MYCARELISWMVFVYLQVDISTMLEEAVNYVKFLQVQIKVYTIGDINMDMYKILIIIFNIRYIH
jgi:hypothetical protein